MTTMILSAVIAATLPSTLSNNCPKFFFGVPTCSINTEADAIAAIRRFCEMAPVEVVKSTATELKVLSEVNHDFYELINSLLWKVELPLNSVAWNNRFELLNCGLK